MNHLTAALLLLVSALAAESDPATLPLVTDGKAAAVIVLPEAPDQWTETAATWLVQYTESVSGAKMKVVREKPGVHPLQGQESRWDTPGWRQRRGSACRN